MIATRKEAMLLIGMHMIPNIVGVARFSYGFHRTVSPVAGLILDAWLGAECVANICVDTGMILLLWKEVPMTRLLGLFVMWNTVSMLFCCGGNLAGLRYPPKWYTHRDMNQLTMHERTKLVIFWAPVIIGLAFVKLYYTSLLYEFYKIYKSTSGKAYDGKGLVRIACSGRSSKALTPAVAKYEGQAPAGPSSLPPQDSLPPAAGTQASPLHTPCGYSEMHSAIVQQSGGTAMSSAIASSVTTPRPVTTKGSAAVTPKPTAETPMITPVAAENTAAVTPKMTDDTPHPAAQDNATVAGDKKSKSRSSRSKKAAGGTADARNTGAGKATTPKIQDDHTRPFQPAR